MAKGIKIKRKELKQPDQFISTTDVVMAYGSKHKAGLLSIVIALVLVVLSGLWFRSHQNIKSLRLETLYFKIEKIKTQGGSNGKEIAEKIENIINEFSEGPQKDRAILILADQYYDIRSFDRAISLYQDILAESSPINLQYQLATEGIAYSLEGKNDYKGAITAYKTIIGNPNNFPLFHIYLSLARCYELDKNHNDALLTLREMKIIFSNHPNFEVIESRLKQLETSV